MKESGQSSMFGLWAQSPPTLTPTTQTSKEGDTTIRQKGAWERELLGVHFSQRPVDSTSAKLSSMQAVSCGEISVDMANETVTVIGTVVSVRQAYTRDKRPFVIATIEDSDSSLEVIAWPNLYASTQGLWHEDNILSIKGLVKTRNGGVQLTCQEAQRYQPQYVASSQDTTMVSQSPEPKSRAEGMASRKGEAAQPRESNPHHLTININQTDETEKDIELLQKVITLLRNYPGQDKVSLTICSEGETTSLQIPQITINYCLELEKELSNILGKDNLRLTQYLI
jgi:DNA polymerase III alpha subunit